tara:strand:+ start:168 stop:521 length:354 start_codon:yes stop_codon:yes gene_type:complete
MTIPMWEVIDKLNKEFEEQYYKTQVLEKRVEELQKQLYEKEVLERVRLLQKNQIQLPRRSAGNEKIYNTGKNCPNELKDQCVLLNQFKYIFEEIKLEPELDFYTCFKSSDFSDCFQF